MQGWPAMPAAEDLPARATAAPRGAAHGHAPSRPREPTGAWPGAPLEPTGDPMVDGVGPARLRRCAPTCPTSRSTAQPKIVPLRVATDFHVDARDPDPRGMTVVGADGAVGGVVRDVWVDRSEAHDPLPRGRGAGAGGARRVLLPVNFTRIDAAAAQVDVKVDPRRAVRRRARASRSPTRSRCAKRTGSCAYYGGGTLYAEPSRLRAPACDARSRVRAGSRGLPEPLPDGERVAVAGRAATGSALALHALPRAQGSPIYFARAAAAARVRRGRGRRVAGRRAGLGRCGSCRSRLPRSALLGARSPG